MKTYPSFTENEEESRPVSGEKYCWPCCSYAANPSDEEVARIIQIILDTAYFHTVLHQEVHAAVENYLDYSVYSGQHPDPALLAQEIGRTDHFRRIMRRMVADEMAKHHTADEGTIAGLVLNSPRFRNDFPRSVIAEVAFYMADKQCMEA